MTEPFLPSQARLVRGPSPRWEWTITPDWYMRVQVPAAPSALHRLMQRWLLGIRWRRLPVTQSEGK